MKEHVFLIKENCEFIIFSVSGLDDNKEFLKAVAELLGCIYLSEL